MSELWTVDRWVRGQMLPAVRGAAAGSRPTLGFKVGLKAVFLLHTKKK